MILVCLPLYKCILTTYKGYKLLIMNYNRNVECYYGTIYL